MLPTIYVNTVREILQGQRLLNVILTQTRNGPFGIICERVIKKEIIFVYSKKGN